MHDVEKCVSLAEIAYKSGNLNAAVRHAKAAIVHCECEERVTALRIFIARCYSKQGKIRESNTIYRGLVNERNYLPPVIMGLLYNNFKMNEGNSVKMGRNLGLIKIFVRD